MNTLKMLFLPLVACCIILTASDVFSSETSFCFDRSGETFGINPRLLESIAKTESNLDPGALNRNPNGSVDMGLMQINSEWIGRLKLDRDRLLSDPCYNTMTGAKILRLCIDRHGYNWEAVGCYNAVDSGKRVKYSWKILNELKKNNNDRQKYSSPESSNPRIPEPSASSSLFFSVRERP